MTLTIKEVIVPEEVKLAPQAWRQMGEEVSEQLDYEPARFIRRRIVRPKFVRRQEIDAVPAISPSPRHRIKRRPLTTDAHQCRAL